MKIIIFILLSFLSGCAASKSVDWNKESEDYYNQFKNNNF